MSVRDQLRPDLRARIDALQEKINSSGIVDIKFTLSPDFSGDPNKLAEDMCHLLEAHFEGRMKPLPPIGDSHCRCSKIEGNHVERDHPDWQAA